MSARKKAAAPTPRGFDVLANHRAALAGEEANLNRLARQLRRAADKIDLAATYWGDGAYGTARAILNGGAPSQRKERHAVSRVLSVVRAIEGDRWRS